MSTAPEFITLAAALGDLANGPLPTAALATLTATRGATFRPAGTRMLVHEDGRIVCELSGGCPQRDIVLRAQGAIGSGQVELARYNAESSLDLLMESGCGGELDVLIEPLIGTRTSTFFDAVAQRLESRRSVVVATLYAFDGQAIAPRRAAWCDEQLCVDELEDADLMQAIKNVPDRSNNQHALTHRLNSIRGEVDVLVERIDPPHALAVIGHCACTRALLSAGAALGWKTTQVTIDSVRSHAAMLPDTPVVRASPSTLRTILPLDRYSSVVVMTHNLEQDRACIAALRDAPVAYLGAMGSRERALRLREDASLSGIDMRVPAGLDIGSETPAEIALAIAAEILAVINDRHGSPLRDSDAAMHG